MITVLVLEDMAKLLTVLDKRNVVDSDSCTSRVEVGMDEGNDIRLVTNSWVELNLTKFW